ncbi:class II aldolase/adducin family protein [Roseiarcaceae bacterium H3SJ34-1]|uniref:class II aldolase/adducin family protein n=1 Tax=Terripilifer ovatus TaxID=3032367 RepID=UPI003AB957C4|nr:class II aldolase/adducin family protein [Roseiarcaceae bacterium H3SJ34-1]
MTKATPAFEIACIDLVIANRVLAKVGAVDAYGHVSVRNPDNLNEFLLSRSLSPEFVTRDDIMRFDLEGRTLRDDNRPPYLERFIHAAIYKQRPDVHAVVHGHPRPLLPFTVTDLKMRPVFMTADEFGADVPVWDIRDRFGDTNMLIVNMEQGLDLAACLSGGARVVLVRGHGFIGAGRSASQLIRLCKALLDNAALILEASRFGTIKELTKGELASRQQSVGDDDMPAVMRGFEYDAIQAGCADLMKQRAALKADLSSKA